MASDYNEYGPVGDPAKQPVDLLVCFAVKEEAKYFLPTRLGISRYFLPTRLCHSGTTEGVCQVWMTGIGRKNASQSIRRAIAMVKPERVITAGFAGGLNPSIKFGAVLFEQDFDAGFGPQLEDLGAIAAKFHCHRRVAITAQEKAELWKSTGADAVEMESSVIRTICLQSHIPSATVRVVSDDATQDLPLDFNALMTSEDRINYWKLLRAVVSRPSRIGKLVEFQRQTSAAARKLGAVLEELLRAERC
jgi:adenosylhomocysteine nucleosidase